MAGAALTIEQALARHVAGDLESAESAYRALLRAEPRHADALQLLGVIARQRGDVAAAVERYRESLAVAPHSPVVLSNLGAALRDLGRPADALQSLDAALALQPAHAEAWDNRGVALADLGRWDDAAASHRRALSVQPRLVSAHYNLANALLRLGRPADAVEAFGAALAIDPAHRDALNNLGETLRRLGRPADALAVADRLLDVDPAHPAGWLNRGNAWLDLRRAGAALDSYDEAVRRGPSLAVAHFNRGNALLELGRAADAVGAYDRAIGLEPRHADALRNRANACYGLGRVGDAIDAYAAALALAPDAPFLLGDWLHASLRGCRWEALDAGVGRIRAGLARGAPVVTPFVARALPLSPAEQRRAGEVFVAAVVGVEPRAAPPPRRDDGRIRVGYFSSDYREHATAHLVAGLFEAHDRSRFEVYAFALGDADDGPMRRRLAAGVDRWVDAGARSDAETAALAREFGIDVAVDLNGYSRGARPGIFAQRAAPLQIGYLGDPGTTGSAFIDYLVVDRTVVPPDHAAHYAEALIVLPDSYQVNDARRPVSDRPLARAEVGLADAGFVFCCFNQPRKITPEAYAAWMRLLRAVDASVLWLYLDNEVAARNLRAAAQAGGVDPARLRFAEPWPAAEHRARYRLADLFLDTFDYNAHATASDALWAGLPVLTRLGETFASRVGASLLRALDLPELVCTTTPGYEATALRLARDPAALLALKRKLAANAATRPLFDTASFTRHLESAFVEAAARVRRGLRPRTFEVAR